MHRNHGNIICSGGLYARTSPRTRGGGWDGRGGKYWGGCREIHSITTQVSGNRITRGRYLGEWPPVNCSWESSEAKEPSWGPVGGRNIMAVTCSEKNPDRGTSRERTEILRTTNLCRSDLGEPHPAQDEHLVPLLHLHGLLGWYQRLWHRTWR